MADYNLNDNTTNNIVDINPSLLKDIQRPVQDQLTSIEKSLLTLTPPFKMNGAIAHHCNGGKRLRPLLVLLGATYGPNQHSDEVNRIATAVEMLHLATLAHDDIIDQSLTRHANPSIYARWGETGAVLVGDYYYAECLHLMAGCRFGIKELSIVVKDLLQAEFDQVTKQFSVDLTVESYLNRVKLKAANFFAICIKLGALTAGADNKTAEILEEYGRAIGIAFQIQDDLLDCAGNSDKIGKPIMQDLQQGIITLPIIYALKHSKNKTLLKQAIINQLRDSTDLTTVFKEVLCTAALQHTRKTALAYISKAKYLIEPLAPGSSKDSMLMLADYVLQRTR